MSESNSNSHAHPHFAVEPVEHSQYTYDATTKPSTEASHTLITKDATQNRSGSPVEPTASRIHPVGVFPHDKEHPKHDDKKQHDDKKHNDKQHDKQHPHDQHAKHAQHDLHGDSHPQPETHKPIPHIEPHAASHPSEPHHHEPKHTQPLEPTHQHPQDHNPAKSTTHAHDYAPTSPSSTISSDSVQTPVSPVFGNAERRQSWSKDEMKRGVMEGLLEKGKGKQAKGGYSSVNTGE